MPALDNTVSAELNMLILARTLSIMSVGLAAAFGFVVIGVARFNLLWLGFEAVGAAAALSFSSAVLAALLALVIAVARLLSGARAGVAQVVLTSAISLLVLAVVAAVG
jgi:hypothetical protein